MCKYKGQGCSHEDTCQRENYIECGFYKYFIFLDNQYKERI